MDFILSSALQTLVSDLQDMIGRCPNENDVVKHKREIENIRIPYRLC